MRSATWDASADEAGRVTDDSVALYKELGRGGVGLIVTGFAFVSPGGQATFGQYGIHSDDMIPGLRWLVRAAHRGGARIAVQIVHSGINSGYLRRNNIEPLAVSASKDVNFPHRQMTGQDIEDIIADFASAAERAREAGFDAVQLHGAHGYLMSQFLSPLSNRRTDGWGGSPEKRRRFHLEVIKRIRERLGDDFPLLIKFGVKDDGEDGLSLEEGVETAGRLVGAGIDSIEVSGGGRTSVRAIRDELEDTYYRDWAAAVKRAVAVPVAVVGGIRRLETAWDIVAAGDADLISMSRPFIREPDLVLRWSRGEAAPARCISCNRCFQVMMRGETLECGEERRLREGSVSPGEIGR